VRTSTGMSMPLTKLGRGPEDDELNILDHAARPILAPSSRRGCRAPAGHGEQVRAEAPGRLRRALRTPRRGHPHGCDRAACRWHVKLALRRRLQTALPRRWPQARSGGLGC
jgi:hypothetical protein